MPAFFRIDDTVFFGDIVTSKSPLPVVAVRAILFDADPNYQLLAICADDALTCFRWLQARRIEAQATTARAA